jgi:recombinational DNA repair protein (RecF pathway)
MSKVDLTYCDLCLRNLPDEKFDYRFDKPVCLECGEKIEPDDPEYPREKIEGEDD